MRTSHRRGAGGRALAWVAGAGLLVVLGVRAPDAAGQTAPRPGTEGCDLCHGELEFLRQRVPTLQRARALLVPRQAVDASAHGGMPCAGCHSGFERFPHPTSGGGSPGMSGAGVSTSECVSCHAEEADLWRSSIHEREDEQADCAACHGIHGVRTGDDLNRPTGVAHMNAACVDCHDTAALAVGDPHADSVPCWSCHGPHDTEAADAAGSRVAPQAQRATCGACHRRVTDSAASDVHGTGLRNSGITTLAVLEHEGPEAPPACTSCHGAHGMPSPSSPDFAQGLVERCSVCHEHYAETFDQTYHGQATALGSRAVATCQDCHSAHEVLPASDPRSLVSEARLVETCRSCHPKATVSFAAFQPHADHDDREKYPHVYWAYHLMTALLIGVFAFFGTHTALWLARLGKDALDRAGEGG